ncbi:T9SS type A sorting domain-containing protein [Labilibacter marinus]|uniref:T9SS type A sorting domain-containing protein n=1 Tax=Labilibacter marinus TaxID=1477105 RepID=UPI0009F9114E|nr:T9SS type A sorting domain-containing protein [Labilibacter marinus]
MNNLRITMLVVFVTCSLILQGQTLKEKAQAKINTLETLITECELQGIDALKEKMTVRTAEVFLDFADWDESHQTENIDAFKLVKIYKDTAAKAAEFLPDFERREVIVMLDDAIAYLTKLKEGIYTRKVIPNLDWSQVSHEGDQLTFNGRPCFTADYTWKPATAKLTEFHGNEDGFYIDQNKVSNVNGDINAGTWNAINAKPSGTVGFIFIGNKNVPQWAEDEYGPGFRMRENTYTGYDIDNPGARDIQGKLLRKIVPVAAGKKYSELGYMLCNEPHFYTTKSKDTDNEDDWDWASGPVSDYTIDKFKIWLKDKHGDIAELNSHWGTSFASFDDVSIDIPIYTGLIGSPKWYDWVKFNRVRVTQWYSDVKDTIQKYDADAKVHLKIMPNLWTDNKRGHGIDMEALTELSEIIGNDSGSENAPMWGEPHEWQEHYAFDWRELYMGFDFYKSVSPEKISYNTETHYLSTGRSRDLFQDPLYARATFWAAATHGLNANQIWVWGRLEDGSIKNNVGNGYAGSNNQQPRIINEVHSVHMDLNSYSEEITAMQRQRKPIRIFHSETSAINKAKHMDDVFELYEHLNFEGVPIGFATKNIITNQQYDTWDVILVYKTQFVTQDELDALQSYLNGGGTVITDNASLAKNEYSQSLGSLTAGVGTIINANTLEEMHKKAFELVEAKGLMPAVSVTETNGIYKKGCAWKCIKNQDGNDVLSIVNLGKTDAKLNIVLKDAFVGTACFDLLNGVKVSNQPTLKPNEVYFIEIKDEEGLGIFGPSAGLQTDMASLFPNPSNGRFNIKFYEFQNAIELSVFNMSGQTVLNKEYKSVDTVRVDMGDFPKGNYLVKVFSGELYQSFMHSKL